MAMDTSADYHESTEKGLSNEKGCSVFRENALWKFSRHHRRHSSGILLRDF
jgi:hypothetical protein